MKRRGASCEAPLWLNFELSLVIQLQSELDLPRIVGSIASGSNSAKTGILEVRRSGDSNNTIAAEPGSVEVGVVEDIEKLRSELETEALGERKFLEDREVQPVESWSFNLRATAAQSGKARQRQASCNFGRIRYTASTQRARLRERGCVQHGQEPGRVRVESLLRVLSLDEESIASS